MTTTNPPAIFASAEEGDEVTLTGHLVDIVWRASPHRLPYATAVLCGDGTVPVEVPPRIYASCNALLVEGELVRVSGVVDRRGDTPLLSARKVSGGEG